MTTPSRRTCWLGRMTSAPSLRDRKLVFRGVTEYYYYYYYLLARASWLLVIGHIPARCRSATSFGPVCDQDSVMEFGFYVLAARRECEKASLPVCGRVAAAVRWFGACTAVHLSRAVATGERAQSISESMTAERDVRHRDLTRRERTAID